MSLRTVCKRQGRDVKGEASVHWLLTPLGKERHPCILGVPMTRGQSTPTGTSGASLGEVGVEAGGCSTSHCETEHYQCKLGQNVCRRDHSGSTGGLRGCEARHKRRLIWAFSKGCWVLLPGSPELFFLCSLQGLMSQLFFPVYKPHHSLPVRSFWAHINHSQFLLPPHKMLST